MEKAFRGCKWGLEGGGSQWTFECVFVCARAFVSVFLCLFAMHMTDSCVFAHEHVCACD